MRISFFRNYNRLVIIAALVCQAAPPVVIAIPKPAVRIISDVYRFKEEQHGRFSVWIVDGGKVRDSVYAEWLYGGNGERYRFNPPNEIWIDNDISCQEYRYTLAHELRERHLMAKFAWTYDDAHDSALMLEDNMRLADSLECALHEASLPPVPPIDCDSTKELPRLPNRIRLRHIYLQHFESLPDSTDVWIVDGNVVRRDIFPDFGFSGNDLAYHFIPHREIWLDNSMSCEDIKFSLLTETKERTLMSNGIGFDSAYETAVHEALREMHSLYVQAADHLPVFVPNPPDRDTGTGDEAHPKTISQSSLLQGHEAYYRTQPGSHSHGVGARRTYLPHSRIPSPSQVVR